MDAVRFMHSTLTTYGCIYFLPNSRFALQFLLFTR